MSVQAEVRHEKRICDEMIKKLERQIRETMSSEGIIRSSETLQGKKGVSYFFCDFDSSMQDKNKHIGPVTWHCTQNNSHRSGKSFFSGKRTEIYTIFDTQP